MSESFPNKSETLEESTGRTGAVGEASGEESGEMLVKLLKFFAGLKLVVSISSRPGGCVVTLSVFVITRCCDEDMCRPSSSSDLFLVSVLIKGGNSFYYRRVIHVCKELLLVLNSFEGQAMSKNIIILSNEKCRAQPMGL